MKEAIAESKAIFVYVCNIMTKWGETHSYVASRFAQEVLRYTGLKKLDSVICNIGKVRPDLIEKYKAEKAYPVEIDTAVDNHTENLICADITHQSDIVRHDSTKLAQIILKL
jgi:uncharacterized cofD-like protein